jgi:hypothetical protein
MRHGLITGKYKDTTAKCRHLIKLPCKGTLRQVFICLRPSPLLGFCLGWSTSNSVGSESDQILSVKLLFGDMIRMRKSELRFRGSGSERNIYRPTLLTHLSDFEERKKKTWPTFSVLASSQSPSSMSRWSGLSRLSVGATPSSCSFSSHVNLHMRTIVIKESQPSSLNVNLRMRRHKLDTVWEGATV